MISKVEKSCSVCLQYKKAPLEPVLKFSLSKDFDDVISIALKGKSTIAVDPQNLKVKDTVRLVV